MADASSKKLKEPTSKDRRRFAFDKAGELWMSDVMHGPAVSTEGSRKLLAAIGNRGNLTGAVHSCLASAGGLGFVRAKAWSLAVR